MISSLVAGTQYGTGVIQFKNANGVSFGISGSNVLTASVAAGGGVTPAISGSNGSFTFSTVGFGNSNGLSFYSSNGSIVGSYTVPSTTQFLTTARASNDAIGLNSAITNGLMTANSSGISLNLSNHLTTARASNDAIGLNSGLTANGVSMTANSSGLSINFPAFLTTARRSTDGIGLNTAITNGLMTGNSSGLSLDLSALLTTARRSTDGIGLNTAITANGAGFTANSSGLSLNLSNFLTSQTNQNISLYALGNTTQNSSTVINASALSFNGLGLATVGFSSGSIQVSVNAPAGGGISAVNISAGLTNSNISNFSFKDTNGVSFGLDGSTITATVRTNYQSSGNYLTTARASNDAIGLNSAITNGLMTVNSSGISLNLDAHLTTARASNDAIGLNTALTGNGVAWTVNSSGLSLNVPAFLTTAMQSNAATISNIRITAGAANNLLSQISFSNIAGGVSFGLNGSTITASAPAGGAGAGATLYHFEPAIQAGFGLITHVGSAQTRPFFVPFNVPGNILNNSLFIQMSRSVSNGSNAFTVQAAIYTQVNETQMSLLGSIQNVFSNATTGSVNSVRYFALTGWNGGNASSITPGAYVLGLNFSAANTLSMNYQLYGEATVSSPVGYVLAGTDQFQTNTTVGIANFWGRYSAGSAGFPGSVAQSQIIANFSGTQTPLAPYFAIRP